MRVNTLQDELQVANEASTPHEQNAGNNDIVQQAMFQRKECIIKQPTMWGICLVVHVELLRGMSWYSLQWRTKECKSG